MSNLLILPKKTSIKPDKLSLIIGELYPVFVVHCGKKHPEGGKIAHFYPNSEQTMLLSYDEDSSSFSHPLTRSLPRDEMYNFLKRTYKFGGKSKRRKSKRKSQRKR